jgi:hypothetical protein
MSPFFPIVHIIITKLHAQCFRVIYVYMAFAVFDIFFLITSLVAIQVLQVRVVVLLVVRSVVRPLANYKSRTELCYEHA